MAHAPEVVVGGASGIGAAVAERARRRGAPVSVWDLREPCDVRCDVADPGAVERAVAATVAAIGLPERVTVTAGVGHAGLLLDLEPEAWDRIMTINTRGPLLVLRAWARQLIDAGRPASLVALSSVSARIPDRNMGAYCASKAALSMVIKVAAAEWAAAGIRVNGVAPGVTDTPMLGGAPLDRGWLARVAARTALGAVGRPDRIAEAVEALHSTAWVTGQILDCDGGLGLHSPIDSYAEVLRAGATRS